MSVSIESSTCVDLHILAPFASLVGILKESDVGVSCDTVTVTGFELGIQFDVNVPVLFSLQWSISLQWSMSDSCYVLDLTTIV